MCGFVGYFGSSNIKLDEASKEILHRGPDMQGKYKGRDWKVNFNRLSIIDLKSSGMQPFKYMDVTVFFNGEIYNYIELKSKYKNEFRSHTNADGEILPFLYKKKGIGFLNELNGMFAIIVIDHKRNKKYIIRDRFGQKPIYYSHYKNNLLFASEIRSIKVVSPLKLSKLNLNINMNVGFLPNPITLYENVFALDPGSYIEHVGSKKTKKFFWYNPKIIEKKRDNKYIAKKFHQLLDESIKMHLRSDVPVGLFLSGGIDSSLILKTIHKLGDKKIIALNTEIIGKADSEKNNTDIINPQKLCTKLKIKLIRKKLDFEFYNKNIVSIVNNYEGILLETSILNFYFLSSLAKKNNIKVILTGAGNDEAWSGYPWTQRLNYFKNFYFLKLNLNIGNFLRNNFFFKILNKIKLGASFVNFLLILSNPLLKFSTANAPAFKAYMESNSSRALNKIYHLSLKYLIITKQRFQRKYSNIINHLTMLLYNNNVNVFTDLSCMYNSIENRSPFQDHRIFEFLMSVPTSQKSNFFNERILLKKIVKKYLPEYITNAKKSGPTLNFESILKNIDKKIIKVFLVKNIKVVKIYISVNFANKIKNDFSFLYLNHASLLFGVLNLIIWHKINIDKTINNYNISFLKLIKNNN
jgi:asparagine synthase (glutamine-hydrolysing)